MVAADVGTDHAYLPVWLVATGKCPRVIATDSSRGALAAAKRTVETYGLAGCVDLRLGDGLEVISPGETGAIVVAGMGGLTICSILSAAMGTVVLQRRLVLQPMSEPEEVRRWAAGAGLPVADEDLVAEGGRFYEVICLDPPGERDGSAGGTGDGLEYEIGAALLRKRHPLLAAYVELKISECEGVIRKMEEGVADRGDPRLNRWIERKRRLEEVLRCL